MNKQLRCEHICAAAFLAFSGQLRTTGAEDFHKRERGGERGNIDVERDDQNTTSTVHQNIFLNWHFPLLMLTLRKLLSRKRNKLDKNLAITASFLPIKQKCHC